MKKKQQPTIQIKKAGVEAARATWAKVAKQYDWYQEPFYVQLFVSRSGTILDSVSFRGMKKDIVVVNSKPYTNYEIV